MEKKHFLKIIESLGHKEPAFIQFACHLYESVANDFVECHAETDLKLIMSALWKLIASSSLKTKVKLVNLASKQSAPSSYTHVMVFVHDMPFLVNSIRMLFEKNNHKLHHFINISGIEIARVDQQTSINFIHDRQGDNLYSLLLFEISRIDDPQMLAELKSKINDTLSDLTYAVKDWPLMQKRICSIKQNILSAKGLLSPGDSQEIGDFFDWLNIYFTFIGARSYDFIQQDGKETKLLPKGPLGVLRKKTSNKAIISYEDLSDDTLEYCSLDDVVIVSKTNTLSTIHRSAYTDLIIIKKYNNKMEIIGEDRFIGLFTSDAYESDPTQIPWIRKKIKNIISSSKFTPNGYNQKLLSHILRNHPRDELFQSPEKELRDVAFQIVALQEKPITRAFIRQDVFNRFVTCLVVMPSKNYSTNVEQKIIDFLLHSLDGLACTVSHVQPKQHVSKIYVTVKLKGHQDPKLDIHNLQEKVVVLTESWDDQLYQAIIQRYGKVIGEKQYIRFQSMFPINYRSFYSASCALSVIRSLEEQEDGKILVKLNQHDDEVLIQLYCQETKVMLSKVLPTLVSFGFQIIEERTFELNLDQGKVVYLNEIVANKLEYIEDLLPIENAISTILNQHLSCDILNKLIGSEKADLRKVMLLRAYANYLKQIGFKYDNSSIKKTLVFNHGVTQNLIKLFYVKFDPSFRKSRSKNISLTHKKISSQLDELAKKEAEIFYYFLNLILATLRTNYFQVSRGGQAKPYISFKIKSCDIPKMPRPIPYCEIFVYSDDFEGVHLRGGKISRGGIRYSDRLHDYRTEVLGLMKAQQVKNALIIPAGAKGGFVLKHTNASHDNHFTRNEVLTCYQNFISGLLDVTDNAVDQEITSPKDLVAYDGGDSYLVVAADKGTATFSDAANVIAGQYQFWLRDAFASGGKDGYDHKKMGITAKGAWESVKWHFRKKNIDVSKDVITVVGIGDMGGDVFGNGMLLSNKIKLLGAFSHKFIFIDPNPDPTASYQERKRLFDLQSFDWTQYSKSILSKGGVICTRHQRWVEITQEIKALLGIKSSRVTSEELIRLILKMKVDLLWNGGIGTYVKHSDEKHHQVGDHQNEPVRINANELRCQVVAEGGNLGLTQLARVQYEEHGGFINTDFIDNSGGVDCSDLEVNIKILLNQLVEKNTLTIKQRNAILHGMTDEVEAMVLRHNYDQNLVLSISQFVLPRCSVFFENFVDDLETKGELNRELEFIPTAGNLAKRKLKGNSYTRPELSVMLAYSKNVLKKSILEWDVHPNLYLSNYLYKRFPKILVKQYHKEISQHKLAKEITATQITHEFISDVGITFSSAILDDLDLPLSQVISAYILICHLFNVSDIRSCLYKNESKLPVDKIIKHRMNLRSLVRRGIRWLIRNHHVIEIFNDQPNLPIDSEVYRKAITKIQKEMAINLAGDDLKKHASSLGELIHYGISHQDATQIAQLNSLLTCLNIATISANHSYALSSVIESYLAIVSTPPLNFIRKHLNVFDNSNKWEAKARFTLRSDWDRISRDLTVSFLTYQKKFKNQSNYFISFKDFLKTNKEVSNKWDFIISSLINEREIEISTLLVLINHLHSLNSALKS
jgi:glutamate dehydrogenase